MSKLTGPDENSVKSIVKDWFEWLGGWSYAPIQTGMGEHGIPDRVGCVPIIVTPEMVGKTIGLFVAVEAKKPGRRGEKYAGLNKNQLDKLRDICKAHGVGGIADRDTDLQKLWDIICAVSRGESIDQLTRAWLDKRTGTGDVK